MYLRPANAFVADFVGLSNRLPGRLDGDAVSVLGTRLPLVRPASGGPEVTALVRPESVDVVPDADGTGRVVSTTFLGPTSRVTVAVGGDPRGRPGDRRAARGTDRPHAGPGRPAAGARSARDLNAQ
nr:hypothetical protein GCM10020092_058310 [Actinoplanes digitatis]